MLRKITVLAALTACVLAATGSSAPAATYIHGGAIAGNLLPSGTNFGSGLRSGTNVVIATSIGTVTCSNGGLGGMTTSASGSSVVSGVLAYGSAGMGFSSCSDTIPFIDLSACDQALGRASVYTTAYSSAGGTFDASSLLLQCYASTGFICQFSASFVNGTFSNSNASATYTGVPLTGSGTLCPSSGTLSMTFAPMRVTSGAFAGRNVIINTNA